MTATDWASVIYAYTFVSGAIGSVVWFLFKKAMRHAIDESKSDLKAIKHEVTPNTGSSLHDKINKEVIPMLKELRENQAAIRKQVDKLEGRFEQHVEEWEDWSYE